jgi:hypothetical protein
VFQKIVFYANTSNCLEKKSKQARFFFSLDFFSQTKYLKKFSLKTLVSMPVLAAFMTS